MSIPVGWTLERLGELGYTYGGLSGKSKSDFQRGNAPYIPFLNVLTNPVIDLDYLDWVTVSPGENQNQARAGDLFFNTSSETPEEVGMCSVLLGEMDELYLNSFCFGYRLSDPSAADGRYLAYFFRSECGRGLMHTLAQGATRYNLSKSNFLKLEVPLPPLPEQCKIAEILSTWDDALALLDRRIELAQQRKKGLAQRLLTGRVRFPEFVRSTAIQSTRYGELPADWRYVPIGSVAREVSLKNRQDRDLPVLSCTKHDGLVDSLEYFGRQIFSNDLTTYKVVERGQFAYATNHIEEGSIGYQAYHDAALISPMYTVFQPVDQVDDDFLFRVLKTEKYRHIFEINTSGTVDRRGSLRWADFSSIRIPLPTLPEQHRIAEVLRACDEEITLLRRKRELTAEQKKGLMQRLLTGRVRVKV